MASAPGWLGPCPSPSRSLEPWAAPSGFWVAVHGADQGSWDSSILSSLSQLWLWSSLSQKLQNREEPGPGQSRAWPRGEERERLRLSPERSPRTRSDSQKFAVAPQNVSSLGSWEARIQRSFPGEDGAHSPLAGAPALTLRSSALRRGLPRPRMSAPRGQPASSELCCIFPSIK